ncbi:MAG: metallophosphoesterase [Anaerolineae bacterium]|nr:metallophosphoesterase [Anaerolineae bacterium]
MDVTVHHLLNLGFIAISLVMIRRLQQTQKSPFWLSVGAVTVQSGLLFTVGAVSALAYPTNNFGRGQLVAWTLFLYNPLLLIGLTAVIHKFNRKIAYGCGAMAILILLIALDAFLIEPYWLKVSYVTLPTAKIETPVRIAILADIQTDAPGTYEANAIRRTMDAQPDLILFAGDYIHLGKRSRNYEYESAALNTLLEEAEVNAPLGAFVVRGNVDPYGEWMRVFEGLPIVASETRAQFDLGKIHLTTLSLQEAFNTATAVSAEEDTFHIVLGHSPNFSLGDVNADLLIAGHTHGGQVQLPILGPILTLSAVPREWASGVTEIAPGKTLIVSNGIGLERGQAPRLRFLCRPEVIIVDLVPEVVTQN